MIKLAIHKDNGGFSERWVAYCEKNNVFFKIVNCFDNNIIQQIRGCNAILWHHHHNDFKDVLVAKKILFAIEQTGIKVFPDFNTGWHFDDKIAQKYLLEIVGAPHVVSYVFYDKRQALNWIKRTTFPKVFKLKGGAGSANVKLVKSSDEARKLLKISFGMIYAIITWKR
jgi:glutathione synthase/RimK-type ligase-like ATP-grasp enzyme